MSETTGNKSISLSVNGASVSVQVADRLLLSELLRDKLALTGTHIGCDTSQCGACVVHVDGKSVKSCTLLAVQADGCTVDTIEGLSDGDELHPMQQAFKDCHGLQCGFCTSGMVMSALDLIKHNPDPDEQTVREWLDGNLCRCTGYQNIVQSIQNGARMMNRSSTG